MSPAEIRDAMYSKTQPYDIVQAVLQQEIALYCGKLIMTNHDLFDGILKIRMGYVCVVYSSCIVCVSSGVNPGILSLFLDGSCDSGTQNPDFMQIFVKIAQIFVNNCQNYIFL